MKGSRPQHHATAAQLLRARLIQSDFVPSPAPRPRLSPAEQCVPPLWSTSRMKRLQKRRARDEGEPSLRPQKDSTVGMSDSLHSGTLLKLNRSTSLWSEGAVKPKQIDVVGHHLCYKQRGVWRATTERVDLHKVHTIRLSTISKAPPGAFDIETHVQNGSGSRGKRRVFTFGGYGSAEDTEPFLWLCCGIVPAASVDASLASYCKARRFLR